MPIFHRVMYEDGTHPFERLNYRTWRFVKASRGSSTVTPPPLSGQVSKTITKRVSKSAHADGELTKRGVGRPKGSLGWKKREVATAKAGTQPGASMATVVKPEVDGAAIPEARQAAAPLLQELAEKVLAAYNDSDSPRATSAAKTETPPASASSATAPHVPPASVEAAGGEAGVRRLLNDLGLGMYAEAIVQQGYDDLDFVRRMEEHQINQMCVECGITKPGHRMKLAVSLRRMRLACESHAPGV